MRLSKLLAIIAWCNTFAAMWVMMLVPIEKDRWIVIFGFLLFLIIAVVSSMSEANKS